MARTTALSMAACIASACAASSAIAASLENGGFETPVVLPSTTGYSVLSAPATIGPWSVESGSIHLGTTPAGTPCHSNQCVGLNGASPGSISQAFETPPDSTCTVGFWISRHPRAKSASLVLRIAGSTDLAQGFTHSAPSAGETPSWEPRSQQFATQHATTITTLTFASDSPATFGTQIDDVTVSCVASPLATPLGPVFPPPSDTPPDNGPEPASGEKKKYRCQGKVATIVGNNNDNLLVGTQGDDVIVGRGGRDDIRGLGGNDRLCGDKGDDRIDGADGDDRITGAKGQDLIFGGQGSDRISGGRGRDSIGGEAGDDRVSGGTDNDLIVGGAGDDVLLGGWGKDRLEGNQGRDSLLGGFAADVLFGDEGNDRLHGGPASDKCSGGAGFNVMISCP